MCPENMCPVYFHNFRGYDSHLILWTLVKQFDTQVRICAKNFEHLDIVSVQSECCRLRFLDRNNQLSAQLSKLANNVLNYKYVLSRINTKAPFPYEWFDSPAKLTVPLPMEDDAWYSHVQGEVQDKQMALAV